jgi:hypothetical protein
VPETESVREQRLVPPVLELALGQVSVLAWLLRASASVPEPVSLPQSGQAPAVLELALAQVSAPAWLLQASVAVLVAPARSVLESVAAELAAPA